MLTAYRKISPINKMVALILFLGIIFAYNITSTPANTLNSVVIAGALAIALHVLIQYPRFSKIAIVSIIQIVMITIASLLYGGYFGLLFGVNPDLAIMTASSALLALSFVIIYIVLDKAYGGILINLIIAFLLLDFSGLAIGLWLGLEYLLSIIISAVIAFTFVFVRCIDYSKKSKTIGDSASIREEVIPTNNKILEKIITENGWEYLQVPEHENYWVINTGKNILITTSISLKENVQKTKTGYLYKNIPLENIIAELAEEAGVLSQEYKIPRNKTHFAILDINNRINLPAKGYERFEITLKKDKTSVKTRMILAAKHGLALWVDRSSEEKISQAWDNFKNRVNNPKPKKVKKSLKKKEKNTEIIVNKTN